MKTKLSKEQNRLNEKKRRLQKQELDLERCRKRLNEREIYLRKQANPARTALPLNTDSHMLSDETSFKWDECLYEALRISREENSSVHTEVPGGGFADENDDYKCVSVDSTNTSMSKPWSQGYLSSPEKPLSERSNDKIFTLNLKSTDTSTDKLECDF